MKFGRVILLALIFGAGFLLGNAWDSSSGMDNEQSNQSESAQDSVEAIAQKRDFERLNNEERHTIQLFENAAPSVVYITTSALRQDYWTRRVSEVPQGTGSGFIWDKEGHIVTNYHVIRGSDKCQVTLYDQSTYDAEVIGFAPEKDLAVLKINSKDNILKPIPIGNSGNLRVGQTTYAIGNPFGLDHTLTTGIVSALGREIESMLGSPIRDVIQTDAAINPGNSGGPLLNSKGQLIGVNTAIYSPSGAYAGIGFSIPVDAVNWIIPDLITYKKINRPVMGVELARDQIMRRLGLKGVLVIDVVKNGGAEKAGLKPTYYDRNGRLHLGDIIIRMGDEKIEKHADILLALEKYKPGDQLDMTVLREEKEVSVTLELGSAE